MEDEENNPEKKETTKKMEGGGDLLEEETTTKKTEDEEDDPEEEETPKTMAEASDPIEEETTRKIEGEVNDPEMEETTERMEEVSDPMEEEKKPKEMEEEKNPEPEEKEARWVLTSSPPHYLASILPRKRKRSQSKNVKVILKKKKRTMYRGKKKIVEWEPPSQGKLGESLELGLIPIPPTFHKFGNMEAGSSSKHDPDSKEVVLEHRLITVDVKPKFSKPEDPIELFLMPPISESSFLEPSCIEEMEIPDLKDSQLPQLVVDCDDRKAEDGPRRWRPPENGWLKMNVEGLISEHSMATCGVVRNSDGGFVAANSDTWEPVTYLDTAKLIAVRNALIWAETGDKVRHDKVVVEINSEQVVQHLRAFENVEWMLPDDIREIVDECIVLSTHFETIEFAYISAEENRLAHCLASRALYQECVGDWDAFNAPDWLQEAIMEDLPE